MGKDVKIGLMVGLGILALIVIFWSSRPPVEIEEEQTALAPTDRPQAIFDLGDPTTFGSGQETVAETTTAHEGSAPMSEFQLGMDSVQTEKLKDDGPIRATIVGAPRTEKAAPPPAMGPIEKVAEQEKPAQTPPPVQQAQTKHKIRKGETLSVLARKYYKNELQWRRIFDANRETLSRPDLVYENQVLVIPPASKKSPVVKAERLTQPVPKGAKTYKVQKGDSLFRIAKREYKGDGTQWTRIFRANRKILGSADRVIPGQLLVIPQ